MTSLHRRFPGWATHDPDSAPLYPTAVAMHFTTARPLEVRLRIPLALVIPGAPANQWASWPCDRVMLKASCWVVGSKFGIGDVRVGMPNVHHWAAELRPRNPDGLRVALGTHAALVREFVADAERLSPIGEEHIDVDALIDSVLGGA